MGLPPSFCDSPPSFCTVHKTEIDSLYILCFNNMPITRYRWLRRPRSLGPNMSRHHHHNIENSFSPFIDRGWNSQQSPYN